VTEALWRGVDELTKPRHVKLLRDHGTVDWPISSLWQLLEESVMSSAALDGGGKASRYRAPVDLECLELRSDIRETVVDALAGHNHRPRATVPESIRALASLVVATVDDDLVGWWAYRFGSWCRLIRNALALDTRPRGIRGMACPECGNMHVIADSAEGPRREAALIIDFVDGRIRAVSCQHCDAAWFRGDALWALADADAVRVATGMVADAI
jgi:hypothetical protein